jgi:hypothetical protein
MRSPALRRRLAGFLRGGLVPAGNLLMAGMVWLAIAAGVLASWSP